MKKFNFKKFNDKYLEYLKNPPTKFKVQDGNIVMRKELVRNILVSIRHLTQELDVFMLFVGREGAGKSKFVRQINYVYWFFLTEFEMIDYPFNIDLVHFGVHELQEDRKIYDFKELKYRISILDESKDDLGRDKHTSPAAKHFIDYMRRCRSESGILSFLMPQLSEFLPRLILSRALFVFEVDYDTDPLTYEIIRGEYKFFVFPRGKKGKSIFRNRELSSSWIKNKFSEYLYNQKRQFENIPTEMLFFQGNFNNVDPIPTNIYDKKKTNQKWERVKKQEQLKKDVDKLRNKMQDFRNLMLSLKRDGESNYDLAERIGKSESSVRNIWKMFENT